jgi:hypothetical protein
MRLAVENFARMPKDFRGKIPRRDWVGLMSIAQCKTVRGVNSPKMPSATKAILWASKKPNGENGKIAGRKLPRPDPIVKITKDRLNVAGLVETDVESARYAFQVEMNKASDTPPTKADTSRVRKSDVIPRTIVTGADMRAPRNISTFLPYRSERMEKGILNTTAARPKLVRITPTSVIEIPSNGRNTAIAT